jgi:hypothetical protein
MRTIPAANIVHIDPWGDVFSISSSGSLSEIDRIATVAMALLEHGELSADEIDQLMRPTTTPSQSNYSRRHGGTGGRGTLHSWQSDYFEVVDAFFGYTTVRASDSRRRGAATLPVPSQSPMPAHPESA